MKYETLSPENNDIDKYLDTAMLAGCLALENGGETARSEETMEYILKSSGIDDCLADISSSNIFASLSGKTKIAKVTRRVTNLNRVCVVNSVSRDLCSGKTDIISAYSTLLSSRSDNIYPLWLRLAASMLVAALLPLFLGSNPYNCIAAIFNGLIMGLADELFSHVRIRYFIVNIFEGLLMVFFTDLFAIITNGYIDVNIVLAASIAPLLPGIALTNGVRDILSGDYISGAGRMLEALVKALSLALGVGTGLKLEQIFKLPARQSVFLLDQTNLLIIQIIAAFIIAVGYSIRMSCPKNTIWSSALAGFIGRIAYTLLLQYTAFSAASATLIAAILVALSANLMARRLKTPTIVFLICGIMSLVPGSYLYSSVNSFVFGDLISFRSELVTTIMVSGAIAVAIFIIDTIFNIITLAKKKRLIIK